MTVLTPQRTTSDANRLLLQQEKTSGARSGVDDDFSSSFNVLEEKKSADQCDITINHHVVPEATKHFNQKLGTTPMWHNMISQGMSLLVLRIFLFHLLDKTFAHQLIASC